MKQLKVLGLAVAATLWAGGAQAEELTGTLKNIKETGAITLGFRDSSIPFSYLDDNQKPIGYAMDICMKIVEAVKKELKLDKLEVKLNPVTSSTRIPLLANGTIDLECGSTTNNVERQKQISFTNTHFLTASRFVSKKASKINSIDDLKGKTVVSTAGTTNIKQLTEANAARNLGATIVPAKDHAEAFLMVETDRAAAFVMDDILLASLVAGSKNPDDYVISKDAFSKPEPYGIMLRKDDAPFKKVVDAATAALAEADRKLLDRLVERQERAQRRLEPVVRHMASAHDELLSTLVLHAKDRRVRIEQLHGGPRHRSERGVEGEALRE
jgi:glutamate/aspartate transport system substrate-binding protein